MSRQTVGQQLLKQTFMGIYQPSRLMYLCRLTLNSINRNKPISTADITRYIMPAAKKISSGV